MRHRFDVPNANKIYWHSQRPELDVAECKEFRRLWRWWQSTTQLTRRKQIRAPEEWQRAKLNLVYLARRIEKKSNQSGDLDFTRSWARRSRLFFSYVITFFCRPLMSRSALSFSHKFSGRRLTRPRFVKWIIPFSPRIRIHKSSSAVPFSSPHGKFKKRWWYLIPPSACHQLSVAIQSTRQSMARNKKPKALSTMHQQNPFLLSISLGYVVFLSSYCLHKRLSLCEPKKS